MTNRDDFSQRTRELVALRANQLCSFRGCSWPTSGPSSESSEAVNNTGVAAHIHAAAPGRGARRYLASMSRQERAHIDNAIWLCGFHARLIDADELTYTADVLRAMKREHEENCAKRQQNAILAGESVPDLIAVGPDIVFVGEFLGIDNEEWTFHLRDFVHGGIHDITVFEQIAPIDRYVLVNSIGDGRALRGTPSMTRDENGDYIVRCPVLPCADRIPAADIPKSWALSDSHDLTVQSGKWAMVSGLEALSQQVKTCLSHQRGESPFHRDFGTRFAEYYNLLSGSLWFERFLKLEVIRQAAIPYRQHTPLLCVERVYGIELLAKAPTKNWLPIRVDLDVKGVGRWKHDLSVCVPREPVQRPSFDELLAGPQRDRAT
jgi:hypothetical protein